MVYRQNDVVQRTRQKAGQEAAVDQGLRAYMLSIYRYMSLGVLLTGLVAYAVSSFPELYVPLFSTPLIWVAFLAPLAIVFAMSFGAERFSANTLQMLFWAYSGLMGVSLASLFLAYTGESVARVFFTAAAMFGALSLYGYTTNRDLSVFRAFLFMTLIGLLVAMVINMFVQSSAFEMGISVIGVLLFSGLTAYDTQRLKDLYVPSANQGKLVILGALTLYLDFINLFIFLLRILGNRR